MDLDVESVTVSQMREYYGCDIPSRLVKIYTDGSCNTVSGDGGWAAVLLYNNHRLELVGYETETTSNRMELMAAVRSLRELNCSCTVILHSDSSYVIDGLHGYAKLWRSRKWRTLGGKPVKNSDLWNELLELTARHFVIPKWVKGHSGVRYNEAADRLAKTVRRTNTLFC